MLTARDAIYKTPVARCRRNKFGINNRNYIFIKHGQFNPRSVSSGRLAPVSEPLISHVSSAQSRGFGSRAAALGTISIFLPCRLLRSFEPGNLKLFRSGPEMEGEVAEVADEAVYSA